MNKMNQWSGGRCNSKREQQVFSPTAVRALLGIRNVISWVCSVALFGMGIVGCWTPREKLEAKYEVHMGPYCTTPAERMKLAEFVSHCSGWNADMCINEVKQAACPVRYALHHNNAGFGNFIKLCDDAVIGIEQDMCRKNGWSP